ncbi:hypothetical protein MMC17_001924 [Xylographa soralifera]|nr:hypothetical protein [Xylographa soralifera]
MNLLGWSVALCSGVSVTTSSINGLIAFWDHDFYAAGWQLYLLYVLTAVFSGELVYTGGVKQIAKHIAVLPLFLSGQWLPRILKASLAFSVTGIAIVFCLVLTLRKQSQPFTFITSPYAGTSGWNTGVSWMMGVGNSMYAFGSTDAVIHIAEEMKHPERDIPRTMNLTLAIGFFTTFPLFMVMMLSVKDIDAIANAQLPYAELFYQITDSKAITTFVMVWVTVVLFTALIGQWVTCGRLALAVARDRGLPYSNYFGKISKHFEFPVRTTLMALFFCAAYGLLYLFNTTAFNSIITSAVLYLNITYAVPQGLRVSRTSTHVLPPHPFDLGRLGYVCNLLSPILVAVMGVFICLPPQLPVTAQNMNYTPVVLCLLFLVVLMAWYQIGERFEGPAIDDNVLSDIDSIRADDQ